MQLCRKKSKRNRGQDSDEAYTDDEEEDISDLDSDDERNRSISQGASGDDVSGISFHASIHLLTSLALTLHANIAHCMMANDDWKTLARRILSAV